MDTFLTRRRQPPRNPRINEADPLAQYLLHAWPMWGDNATPRRDLSGRGESGRIDGVSAGSVSTHGGPLGIQGAYGVGGNEAVTFGAQGFGAEFSIDTDGNAPASIIAIIQLRATGTRDIFLADYSAAGSAVSWLFESKGDGQWRASIGTTTLYSGGTADTLPHFVILTRQAYHAPEYCYVDGVSIGGTTSSSAGVAGTQMAIGSGAYAGNIGLNGWVHDLRMYRRYIRPEEAQFLSRRENWFDAYRQSPARTWFISSGAAPSFQAALFAASRRRINPLLRM